MTQASAMAIPACERSPHRVLDFLLPATAFSAFFAISAMQSFLLLAVIVWLVGLVRQGTGGRAWPMSLPVTVFAGVSLLSGLLSRDPLHSLRELREVLLPLALFLLVQELPDRARVLRVANAVVLATAVAAVWGIGQALTYGSDYRVHGSLGHYMSYSGVLAIGASLSAARTIWAERPRERVLAAATTGLALTALVLTHTRSAWLGWLAGATLTAALWKPRSLVLIPVLAVLAFALAPGPVRARMQSLTDASDTTWVERTYMWRSGYALWRDHAWLGVGLGNLRAAYPDYKLPDDPWLEEREFSHLHNNPLQVAGERGALGLAAWFWIWIAWAVLAARAWRATDEQDRLARALLAGGAAALLSFHVAGLFEYNFGDSEVLTLLWFVLALPLALQQVVGTTAQKSPRARPTS